MIRMSLNDNDNDDHDIVTVRCDVFYKLVNWLNVRKSMCIIYLMNKIGVSALILKQSMWREAYR